MSPITTSAATRLARNREGLACLLGMLLGANERCGVNVPVPGREEAGIARAKRSRTFVMICACSLTEISARSCEEDRRTVRSRVYSCPLSSGTRSSLMVLCPFRTVRTAFLNGAMFAKAFSAPSLQISPSGLQSASNAVLERNAAEPVLAELAEAARWPA